MRRLTKPCSRSRTQPTSICDSGTSHRIQNRESLFCIRDLMYSSKQDATPRLFRKTQTLRRLITYPLSSAAYKHQPAMSPSRSLAIIATVPGCPINLRTSVSVQGPKLREDSMRTTLSISLDTNHSIDIESRLESAGSEEDWLLLRSLGSRDMGKTMFLRVSLISHASPSL